MTSRPDLADRIRLKRIYAPASMADGRRVLVDRLWPRGVSRARADLFDWAKEIAPSDALRHWLHANLDRWPDFARRYRQELDAQPEPVGRLLGLAAERPLTLLYAARDEVHNNAVALRGYLIDRKGGGDAASV